MVRLGLIVGSMLLVSACAKTVELPMVSDDDLVAAEASFAPASSEIPNAETDEPRQSLFGRMFGKSDDENSEEVVEPSDGQAVEDIDENTELLPDETVVEQPRRGLLGLFKKREDSAPETSGASVAAAIESTNPAQGVSTEGGDAIAPEEVAELDKPEEPRRGLFGLFGKRDKAEDAVETPEETSAENTIVASIAPETMTDAEPARRGLFGRPRKTEAKPEIPLGTVLPYGQVGIACNVRGRKLGKVIDTFKQNGDDFKLYDTKPGGIEARTHFIMGFDDGCPRQFTGALVMLGSPVLHERMRFDSYNKHLSITETDRAYDKIRRRVCKTRGKTLCPQERVGALEAETAFVTVYQQFGANDHWAEILLHKGDLVATSTR